MPGQAGHEHPPDLWEVVFGREPFGALRSQYPLPSKRGGRPPTHRLAGEKRDSDGLRYSQLTEALQGVQSPLMYLAAAGRQTRFGTLNTRTCQTPTSGSGLGDWGPSRLVPIDLRARTDPYKERGRRAHLGPERLLGVLDIVDRIPRRYGIGLAIRAPPHPSIAQHLVRHGRPLASCPLRATWSGTT